MDQRDDDLLAKQLQGIGPPRNDGLVGLTVVTVFFVGLSIGAYVFAPHGERVAPHDAVAEITMSTGAPPAVQR